MVLVEIFIAEFNVNVWKEIIDYFMQYDRK